MDGGVAFLDFISPTDTIHQPLLRPFVIQPQHPPYLFPLTVPLHLELGRISMWGSLWFRQDGLLFC